MTRATLARCAAFLAVPAMMVGCNEPTTEMEGGEPPPRPAELDRLNALVGTWEGSGEMTMPGADEPKNSTGKNEISWELGDRFLIEELEVEFDEGKMEGVAVWTWDTKAKTYRTWWFDNYGSFGEGTASYDEDTGTFHMKSVGTSSMTGKPSYGKGTIKITDDNSMEWTWTEWDNMFHLGSPTTYKGKSTKK